MYVPSGIVSVSEQVVVLYVVAYCKLPGFCPIKISLHAVVFSSVTVAEKATEPSVSVVGVRAVGAGGLPLSIVTDAVVTVFV